MKDKIPEWITNRIERAERKIKETKHQKLKDEIQFIFFELEELTGERIE